MYFINFYDNYIIIGRKLIKTLFNCNSKNKKKNNIVKFIYQL